MNYLTNYYKNLCEELQAKLDYLKKTLSEAQEMEFGEGGVIASSEEDKNEDDEKNSDPRALKLGKGKVIKSDKVKGLGETKKTENASN
jgi:hypothetical protein